MFTSEEHGQFADVISRMLEYTRIHLTTRAVAESIRQKLSFSVNSILYLSGNTEPDYLRDLVLHGFKEIMGNACHDYPKISFLYTSDTTPANRLYGNGFSYSRLLDEDTTRDSKRDETLVVDILQKRYDLVVYGSYHRGMPLYEYVSQIYTPDKIVLLCGKTPIHAIPSNGATAGIQSLCANSIPFSTMFRPPKKRVSSHRKRGLV